MPSSPTSRRDFLSQAAAATALLSTPATLFAKNEEQTGCTLGFSTYGMKSLKTEDAVQTVAEIGYDAIEIAVRPDWDSAPAKMSATRRREVRGQLDSSGLQLCSLMEHLIPTTNDQEHKAHLIRLAGVFELAADLTPDGAEKPLMQTVLGGGNWEQKKTFFRDRLGDWLQVADKHDMVIAIKPHRGGGMSQPSEAVWLIEQLGTPKRLRMVYDYSHYAFRDLPLDETIATALPYTSHIAVKDAVQDGNRVIFDLPGAAGTIDFAAIIRQFHAGGYRGDINCEVSGMVSGKPGYDPVAAATSCYKVLGKAFQAADVQRG